MKKDSTRTTKSAFAPVPHHISPEYSLVRNCSPSSASASPCFLSGVLLIIIPEKTFAALPSTSFQVRFRPHNTNPLTRTKGEAVPQTAFNTGTQIPAKSTRKHNAQSRVRSPVVPLTARLLTRYSFTRLAMLRANQYHVDTQAPFSAETFSLPCISSISEHKVARYDSALSPPMKVEFNDRPPPDVIRQTQRDTAAGAPIDTVAGK